MNGFRDSHPATPCTGTYKPTSVPMRKRKKRSNAVLFRENHVTGRRNDAEQTVDPRREGVECATYRRIDGRLCFRRVGFGARGRVRRRGYSSLHTNSHFRKAFRPRTSSLSAKANLLGLDGRRTPTARRIRRSPIVRVSQIPTVWLLPRINSAYLRAQGNAERSEPKQMNHWPRSLRFGAEVRVRRRDGKRRGKDSTGSRLRETPSSRGSPDPRAPSLQGSPEHLSIRGIQDRQGGMRSPDLRP